MTKKQRALLEKAADGYIRDLVYDNHGYEPDWVDCLTFAKVEPATPGQHCGIPDEYSDEQMSDGKALSQSLLKYVQREWKRMRRLTRGGR